MYIALCLRTTNGVKKKLLSLTYKGDTQWVVKQWEIRKWVVIHWVIIEWGETGKGKLVIISKWVIIEIKTDRQLGNVCV